jgi:hypothetical protein
VASYPQYDGFAYSFARAELNLNKSIFVGISNVSIDQPTTEGVVMGTRPWPLKRTEGEMGLGEGTITFSDAGEVIRFIDTLGNGWRSQVWNLTWTLTASGAPNITIACQSCKVLSNPFDHGTGEEALGGEIAFSFLTHTVNGKTPHTGLIAPTR